MSENRKVIDINEAGKLSINKCKEILHKNGKKFTDEQVKLIRDFLYVLGEIDYINFQNHIENGKDSDTIYKSFHRRAS